MSVRQRLAGSRIVVTGVTGFLGQALLERLLAALPDTRVLLLVRPRGGTSGRDRVAGLLQQPVFSRLRERIGDEGMTRLLDDRIEVVEGDLADAAPPLPADLDVVIHAASTVAFDPPIDAAFQTNLLGTQRLYEAVRASGSRPHLVHVSTAYVAGTTKGIVPEAPLQHTVDWRAEAEAALAARRLADASSRRPELLERLLTEARREHSRAGPQSVARSAEQARGEWVDRRLVEHGRRRAQSLGWPDVYGFTKALGERCAEDMHGDLPLSVVRPSIIESALTHPHPGWIEGFRMAEPIILGYGRGEIPDFPGVPDGVVDIIPVDLVVNALIAVAATPRPPDRPAYYHVSSGARNPLVFRELYDYVREYFQAHPLVDRDQGEIEPPLWRFRGSARVLRMLRTAERTVEAADRVVSRLPRSDRVRDVARTLDRQRRRLAFVRRYADIYGPYAEAEVIYTDDRAHALYRSLTDEDRRDFRFDATVIDWRHYLQEVHCPSVTSGLRQLDQRRPRPAVPAVDSWPVRRDVIAAFDMDGTIVAANVIESYLWLRMAEGGRGWLGEAVAVARDLPGYLVAERRARETFLRSFYRRYAGADLAGLRRMMADQVTELVLQRAAPAALRRVREHRAAGHRTVLITGALDVLALPLAPLFDEIVAAELATDDDGMATGYLVAPPLVGEARAAWLRRYAERVDADLDASYAYADSHSDLPLLEAVGHPVVVNPDVALFRTARRRRWPIQQWRSDAPHVLVPEPAP
ncbi:MAG TPA: HAD-IB family hydrolase [Nitriliruptorales bacterium]|nr:HAD-IB family hydrolase [Nitriliruptorales bacterium]